jgi:hypothetical protein
MKVRSIGSIAAELLEEPRTAVVQGRTRLGVFIRLDPGWVIFLSCEVERGPLTVNIIDDASCLDNLAVGSNLEIGRSSNRLEIIVIASSVETKQSPLMQEEANLSENHDLILTLEIKPGQVWSASPRPADILPATERVLVVAATIKQAQNIRPTASLAALQAILDSSLHMPEGEAGHFYPHLAGIHAQLVNRQRSTSEAVSSPLRQLDPLTFSPLLGLGGGLTPTGDDILLGMLLALNRWRPVLAPGLDISSLNRNILGRAYQSTTIISANLIECAARGQADERLVTALDSLMTGTSSPSTIAALLASWGSSSGLDALCGMALAITSTRSR